MLELSIFLIIFLLVAGFIILFFTRCLQLSIISFKIASALCFLHALYILFFVLFDVLEKDHFYLKIYTVISIFFTLFIAAGFTALARYCSTELEKEKNSKSSFDDTTKSTFNPNELHTQEPVILHKTSEVKPQK